MLTSNTEASLPLRSAYTRAIHGPASPASTRASIVTLGFAVFALLNLALPKAGIRVGDFPLTWGYLAIGAVAPIALVGRLSNPRMQFYPVLQAVGLFAPIAALTYFKAEQAGLPLRSWLPTFINFGFFPTVMLLVYAPYLEDIRAGDLAKIVRLAIRFAIAWGLMNFILHLATGNFIEIPYVTVNGDEVGETFGKNNSRGGIMKLVSTYNNGNIFGVCMVMLAPLYIHFEKSRKWISLFVLAILCTLSRTAWFGLLCSFMLMVAFGQVRVARAQVWAGAAAAFGVLLLLLPLLGWDWTNVFETDLNGRLDGFTDFELTVFGAETIRIPELVYLGLLNSFGIIGFGFALLALFLGPIYGVSNWMMLSPLRRAGTLSALSYLACALVDGAFIFPPVLVLYLFVTGLIYRRGFVGENGRDLRAAVPARGLGGISGRGSERTASGGVRG